MPSPWKVCGLAVLKNTHATHIESCSCGMVGTVTSAHTVMASQIVDNHANCLGCGYWLDFYFDIAQLLSDQTTQVSVNGSYILPNGIVVLADEDVDAYFNGTLLFYDRDDVPVTE